MSLWVTVSPVSATTGGGPGSETGEGVSLSWALRERAVLKYVLEGVDYPAIVKRCIYV